MGDEARSSVIFRTIPGGGREVEIKPNGQSVAELADEIGLNLEQFQVSVDGHPATGRTMLKPGASVAAAPKVKGA